jgi:DNA-3-methyladenine glycosylase I
MTRNGVPHDDTTLFEFYLETFQAGPKLDNNLEQRENFRAAFDHFDKKIAQYTDEKNLIYL